MKEKRAKQMGDIRILVVDDTKFMRSMLTEMLRRNGYQVVGEGENGQQAIELYQELQPDLVMLDITMPEMNGVEATRRIRELDPTALVLICSAMSQQDLIGEALQAGANDYVVKPFQPEAVRDVLIRMHEWVNRRRELMPPVVVASPEEAVPEHLEQPTNLIEFEPEEEDSDSNHETDTEMESSGEMEQLAVETAEVGAEEDGFVPEVPSEAEQEIAVTFEAELDVETDHEAEHESITEVGFEIGETTGELSESTEAVSESEDNMDLESETNALLLDDSHEQEQLPTTINMFQPVRQVRNFYARHACVWDEESSDGSSYVRFQVLCSERDEHICIEMIDGNGHKETVTLSFSGYHYLHQWITEIKLFEKAAASLVQTG